MKKLANNIFFTLLIISFSTLVSCDLSPDFNFSDSPPINNLQVNTISYVNIKLTNRVWKITNINVSNPNPNFIDYKIFFSTDNTLLATNDIDIYTGTWTVSDTNLNQNVLTDLKLNLVFTSPTIFGQMSKNWTFNSFVTYSYGSEIEFLYINDGVTAGSFFLKEIK